ncbi:hypothetical protein QMZ92_16460 [Streptomyces sp. HNM0645]|uniref:hypothetical protein n=1 Tax=Streptomyces sp. HNM0645 TaxID=2782343 RepID=UPI0024B75980|nr:hypothetical protein [Streptomyces sp. HNM0645]MDI9885928.1 hypothetical protein [Streptomyces sp. HNM0645]
MHAYLITARPTRWQRACRAARVCTVRLVVGAALLTLGLLVLAVRCLRPIVNALATAAVRIELEISIRSGLPSVGASLGAHLTDEFVKEFRSGWNTTKEGARS